MKAIATRLFVTVDDIPKHDLIDPVVLEAAATLPDGVTRQFLTLQVVIGENAQARGQTESLVPKSGEVYQRGFSHRIRTDNVQLNHVSGNCGGSEGKWEVD